MSTPRLEGTNRVRPEPVLELLRMVPPLIPLLIWGWLSFSRVNSGDWGRTDFRGIYASAVAVAHGANGHDPATIAREELRLFGIVTQGDTFPYPPAIYTLLLPLIHLNFDTAATLWAALTITAVLLALAVSSSGARQFSGYPSLLLKAAFVGTFLPFPYLLFIGQLSAIPLIGITGFLLLWRREPLTASSQTAAGVLLAVSALKPHLLFVLYVYILGRCWAKRYWRLIISAAATYLLFLAIPMLINPGTFSDFVGSLQNPATSPLRHAPPATPAVLSAFIGLHGGWFRFIPIGILTVAAFLLARVTSVNLSQRIAAPLLIFPLAFISTPYLWIYDFVVWLPMFLAVFDHEYTGGAHAGLRYAAQCLLVLANVLLWTQLNASNGFYPMQRAWWYPIFTSGAALILGIPALLDAVRSSGYRFKGKLNDSGNA